MKTRQLIITACILFAAITYSYSQTPNQNIINKEIPDQVQNLWISQN